MAPTAWTQGVERLFAELFEHEVAVFLVTSGTAANALALASVTRPWGAVLTHEESHVADDECGAPEFFSDGAKLVGLPGVGNKLAPELVTQDAGPDARRRPASGPAAGALDHPGDRMRHRSIRRTRSAR